MLIEYECPKGWLSDGNRSPPGADCTERKSRVAIWVGDPTFKQLVSGEFEYTGENFCRKGVNKKVVVMIQTLFDSLE
jgi:hypothetical protein